jgi:hypothetical protein
VNSLFPKPVEEVLAMPPLLTDRYDIRSYLFD